MRAIVCILVVAFLAVAANADIVITEVMPGSVHSSSAASGDWFELTNTGLVAVPIGGWSWTDSSHNDPGDKLVFPQITIAAGESVICLEEDDATVWLGSWDLVGGGLQIITETDFDGFWGLGKSGDGVFVYDASNNLVDSFEWISSTDGFSIDIDVYGNGVNSVVGVHGAYASSGDVASPFVVPEPTTLTFLSLGLICLRSSRKK